MKLILASTSPRRIELLKQAGFRFLVRAPHADETPRRGESPRALVQRLSRTKAASVAERLGARDYPCVVIAADTIVVEPGGKKILNKPRNPAEARRMLGKLVGKTHEVLTGYAILLVDHPQGQTSIARVVRSRVKMRKIPASAIRKYVETGEPMDKAGSYAAQGLGMGLIESLSGSYTNVDFPFRKFSPILKRWFRWILLHG